MCNKEMAGFSVSVNDEHLVTISTEDLNVLAVRVHGDCVGPEFASLAASGGRYGEEDNTHLIWLNEQQIAPGDEVKLTFLKKAGMSHSGKTIEELFPDDDSTSWTSQSVDDVFKELAEKQRVRETFALHLTTPTGQTVVARTEPDDFSFGFSVLWDWMHPDVARVSLTSNSLEGIKNKAGGTEHARFRLKFGQSTTLCVSA